MTAGLPTAARTISAAVTDAVAAVRAADADGLDDAVGRLSTADPQRVVLVLGGVVRSLLEELHPDGMDGEDLRAVLEHCTTATAGWRSEVDPTVLLVVLTGALGLSDPDDQPRIPPPAVARNAALLTTHLLGPRPPAPLPHRRLHRALPLRDRRTSLARATRARAVLTATGSGGGRGRVRSRR